MYSSATVSGVPWGDLGPSDGVFFSVGAESCRIKATFTHCEMMTCTHTAMTTTDDKDEQTNHRRTRGARER